MRNTIKRFLKLSLVAAFVAPVFMIGVNSCESCTSPESVPDSTKTSSDTVVEPPKVASNEIDIVLYLDASSSMQGYIAPSKPTNFAAVVGAIEGLEPGNTKSFLYGESPEPADGLSGKIGDQALKLKEPESDLAGMVANMAKEASNNQSTVYFLITDGILSGTNKQIKDNSKYNIANRLTLSQKIYDALKSYKGKVASMVLQFSAPFKGTYFDYKNGKITLKNVMRPYYVIAFGSKPAMKQVYDAINNNSLSALARYENEALFGFDYNLAKPRVGERKGISMVAGGKYKVLSTVKEVPLVYNVSNLPTKLLADVDSLCSHVKIYKRSKNSKSDWVMLGKEYYDVEYNNKKLDITVNNKYKLAIPGEVKVRIGWWQPSWIENMTDTIDSPKPNDMKTFNLKYLLTPFSVLNSGDDANGFLDEDNRNVIQLTNRSN